MNAVLDWATLSPAEQVAALERPSAETSDAVFASVRNIMSEVRARGDAAVREFTETFDKVAIDDLRAPAGNPVSPELRQAMENALDRIERFHRQTGFTTTRIETARGVTCTRVVRPLRRVGLYIPGGSAPLLSTAMMVGVPARLAGCQEIILCTPPRADGTVDDAILAVAELLGIKHVFRIGGAQAIAAMAYGTESVPRCQKVFGPGNQYVTAAKQLIALHSGTAIDLPAGPSELLVIADAGANPEFIAADLLSQAEHGADSQVVLVSTSKDLVEHVRNEVNRQLETLPRADVALEALASARFIYTDTLESALDISNTYAPEHLSLAVADAPRWFERVQSAGSVFLGDYAGEAFGDYGSGPNHVLPTGGWARSMSGVSVASFQTTITAQSGSQEAYAPLVDDTVRLARAEGLEGHARAALVRQDTEWERQ